ncbi:hypothetical protein AMTRI_Chr06g201570 [Amborella trichopoda]
MAEKEFSTDHDHSESMESSDLLDSVNEKTLKEEGGVAFGDQKKNRKKKKKSVLLEGYVDEEREGENGVVNGEREKGEKSFMRTKSLTDGDLDELKGCVDLGFGGFNYEEIPELCNTLPALELCYSISQRFMEDQNKSPDASSIANWKISSPGDHPEEVKARLKFWAQAVACTVRLCN